MKTIVLFLALFFIAGCNVSNYGSHYNVYVEPSSPSNNELAVAALGKWEAKSKGAVKFDIYFEHRTSANSGEIVVLFVSQDFLNSIGNEEHRIGYTVRQEMEDSAIVYISVNLKGSTESMTIEHEVGHAMGLSHSEEHTVMCKSSSCAAKDVTCGDVSQYASLRGIVAHCD